MRPCGVCCLVAGMLLVGCVQVTFGMYSDSSLVMGLNGRNFHNLVKKKDMQTPKVLEFYAPWCGHCKSFAPEYEKAAEMLKGLARVYAVDCEAEKKICGDYDVKGYPTIKVIPPGGVGTMEYTGARTAKALAGYASKFMNNLVQKVTSDGHDVWIKQRPQQAKILLFTDKAKTPNLYKGLSVDFENKLMLGEVRKEEKALVSRYKVKKFPTLLVVLPGQKKPVKYDGKISYESVFEFLNRYQETFSAAAPQADEVELATKPWLSEAVPQMHALSKEDICLKGGAVCVVAFVDGAPGPVMNVLLSMKEKFERHIDRGAKLRFMWVDVTKESAVAEAFGVTERPAVAALKVGKRRRFCLHEGAVDTDSVNSFLDRVIGGDARFKALKSLPDFSPMEEATAKK